MTTYQDQIKSAGIPFEKSYNLDERPHVCIDWEYIDGRDGGDTYEMVAFDSEENARKAYKCIDISALAHTFADSKVRHVKSLWIQEEEVSRSE